MILNETIISVDQEPFTLKVNSAVLDWQQSQMIFSPLSVLHLYLVNGGVVGWEELDIDFEKNFIPVFFFKLVSTEERRELCITDKCGERLSCAIGINYDPLSLW